jgi:DNA-binding NtrC family response regulator
MHRLASYDWPGNVRELKNVAERLVVGSRSGRIETTSLPSDVSARSTRSAPRSGVALMTSSTVLTVPVSSIPQWLQASSTLQQRLDRLMKDRVLVLVGSA